MTHAEHGSILVTGATGTVGRPLIEQLTAAGHRVRALTRDPARAGLPAGVETVAGNLSDPAGLVRAFDGVTAAHLITFGDDYAPLLGGTDIVALARKAGVQRVTVLKGDLGRSPLEEAVVAGGLNWTFLAPVEFMANTLEWADAVARDGVVREGFAGTPSAMIHEADIAAVAAAALTGDGHDGQEYWLTGPEALTPPERVGIIADVVGRDVGFVELSRDEVVAGWREQGYGDDDIAFFLTMRTDPPEAGYTVLPTVQQVTGRPARTFRQWVAEHRAAFGG